MDTLFDALPRFLYASSIRRKAGETCHFPLHRHENIMELLFLVEGKAEYWIDRKHYRASAGDVVLFSPNTWHEEQSDTSAAFEYYYTGFHSLRIGSLPPGCLLSEGDPPVFSMRNRFGRIRQLFQDLLEEAQSGWPPALSAADPYLAVLVTEVYRTHGYPNAVTAAAKASSRASVERARRYISENYNRPITLQQIADEVFLSPSHLSHLFRDLFGESPIQFVISERINAAKRYLSTTSYSIEEISERVGYSSVTAFQNLFKQSTSLSPGQFRKIHREL